MINYTLDTKSSGRQFTAEGFRVGDNGIRELYFDFTEGKEVFSLPVGCIATLFARLPDGTIIYDSCEILGDTAVYHLKGGENAPSLTCLPGEVLCEIRITDENGAMLTSPEFALFIESVLQNDEAIEAQPSFSALTDALWRVLEAETGLDSKVDRVAGTEGNLVVFGADGAISDSGVAPIKMFVFDFTEKGTDADTKNCELYGELKSAFINGDDFCMFIRVEGDNYFPAVAKRTATLTWELSAYDHYYEIIYSIKMTTSGNTYAESPLVNYSESFDESSDVPASQARTAEWVKAYVDEKLLIDTEVVL